MTALVDTFRPLVSPAEIIEPGNAEYVKQSQPWSTHADLHPPVVITPASLESMQKVVKTLYDSKLDFGVRNTGTGSVSAKDVILSTHGFKDFHFDPETEIVTIGSGFCWGEIDLLMEKHAPDYAVLSARCSWVGVTGSALVGGLSWLSHEYGMISDPQNMPDMQVVLGDGRALWASEEPDLLWALRGGGGNFGVVTGLKLRARKYSQKIFAGVIFYPYSTVPELSKGVAAMAAKTADPKVAMHVVNQGPGMGVPSQGSKPGVAIMAVDANGEKHAREEAFKWALELPGAQEISTGEMSLQQVNAVAETFRDYQGNNHFWLCAPLIADIDDETFTRAMKWYEDSIDACPGLAEGSTVLLEFMQEGAMSQSGGRDKTAWPHDGRRHVMQLVLGCRREDAVPGLEQIVHDRFMAAGKQIAQDKDIGEFHAGFLHQWNDLRQVYGENYDKLRSVKKHYDPRNRFNKGVNLAEGRVNPGATV